MSTLVITASLALAALVGTPVLGARPTTSTATSTHQQKIDGAGAGSAAASDVFHSRLRAGTTLGHLERNAATIHQDAAETRAGSCNSQAANRALAALSTGSVNPGEALSALATDLTENPSAASALELGRKVVNVPNDSNATEPTGGAIRAKVDYAYYNNEADYNIVSMTLQGSDLDLGRIVKMATICFCDGGVFLNVGHQPLKVEQILRNNIKVDDLRKEFSSNIVTPETAVYIVHLEGYGEAPFKIKITDKFLGSKQKNGTINVDVAMVELLNDDKASRMVPAYVNVPGGLQVFVGDFPVGCLREIEAEGQPAGGLTVHRDISPFIPAVTEVVLADKTGHARPFQMLSVPQDQGVQLAEELVKVLGLSTSVTISPCAWDFA